MGLDCVCGQTNQLDTTLGELGLELGEGAELGGADGRVVFGVGEEDDPVVADELVEVDGTLGGFGLEVGGDGAQAETVVRLAMIRSWIDSASLHRGRSEEADIVAIPPSPVFSKA